eukprot:13496111-Alexandrium_andersonii.AAC.1
MLRSDFEPPDILVQHHACEAALDLPQGHLLQPRARDSFGSYVQHPGYESEASHSSTAPTAR